MAEPWTVGSSGPPAWNLGGNSLNSKEKNPNHSWPDLNQRELEVLAYLLEGQTEKEIGETLSISSHTVHAYIKRLYAKFKVSSRGQLLATAYQLMIFELRQKLHRKSKQ